MEQEHRNKIRNNIEKLMEFTEYAELMEACLKYQLLFDPMRDQIESNPDPIQRHRMLIEKITHRGPTAYKIFERILKELFPHAAETLTNTPLDVSIRSRLHRMQSNNGNQNETNHIRVPVPQPVITVRQSSSEKPSQTADAKKKDRIELKEYTEPVRPTVNLPFKYSAKIHGLDDCSKVGVYPMNSRNRGIFIMVNNVSFASNRYRNGALVDRDNLIHLFRKMKFKVFYYEDLVKDEFVRLIRKLAAWNELQKFDCFILAVLSHGDGNEVTSSVQFLDHQTYETSDILNQFNNFNCKQLIGKPKVFLFPFCRGSLSDPGVSRIRQTENDSAKDKEPEDPDPMCIPTFTDMKICYATLPGYNAFRDPTYGSWYVEIMCKVFAEHAHDNHFEDLLKLVGEAVNQMRTERYEIQTTANEDRGFTKRLFINPGFFPDGEPNE